MAIGLYNYPPIRFRMKNRGIVHGVTQLSLADSPLRKLGSVARHRNIREDMTECGAGPFNGPSLNPAPGAGGTSSSGYLGNGRVSDGYGN